MQRIAELHRGRVSFAIVLVALFAVSPVAMAQDRTDPIPARVGPPGGIDFLVNPAVPATMDAARYLDVVGRSLGRWGDRQAGVTGVVPGVADGRNVLGINSLPAGVLGQTTQFGTQTTTVVPDSHVCAPSGTTVVDQSLVHGRHKVRLRLRRDVLRHGRVRHRSRRVSVARYRDRRRSVTLPVSGCRAQRGVRRSTTTIETDVELAPTPAGGVWQMGPDKPTSEQWDFETNLLHELGHVSGLRHQRDSCDPLSPMPASEGNGDWWHAADDWNHAGCSTSVASTPTPGSDSAEPIGPGLGGATLSVNPAVPPGVDPARWLAVAQRVIARAGARFGGTTSVLPQPGDDANVVGFMPLTPTAYEWPIQTPVAVTSEAPVHGTCTGTRRKVRERFVARRTVRVRGHRLRRDVLRTRRVGIASFKCRRTAASVTSGPASVELDLALNGAAIAWEAGPGHPDDGTRMDLETAVVQGVAALAGAPAGAPCAATTPNASLAFGDWWRSSSDVRRANCEAVSAPLSQSSSDEQIRVAPGPGTQVGRKGVLRQTDVVPGR